MKYYLILAFNLLLGIDLLANDGVYLTNGSLIYPIHETSISLEKEELSFQVRESEAKVSIQFQFFNPETETRKLLVGFQAPRGGGDVSTSLLESSQIKDFQILHEGQALSYKIMVADCEDCALREIDTQAVPLEFDLIYVYLFEISFKPGRNSIEHSYRFPASHNVSFNQIYNYILTTGAKRAGGKIKDLTVNIDMGLNSYFYVSDIFGEEAHWQVLGRGLVVSEKFDFHQDSCRMVRTLDGSLQIKVKDFEPTKNIEFGIVNELCFINTLTDYEAIKNGWVLSFYDYRLEGDYSANELRLLRNTIYAQKGYTFKSPDLRAYFNQFPWYMPDPKLKLEDILLSADEEAFMAKILRRERDLNE